MKPTPENIRRWAIINIPKSNSRFDGLTYSFQLYEAGRNYFKIIPGRDRYFGENLTIYIWLWYYFCKLPISKLEKLRYWKYYTRTIDIAKDIKNKAHFFTRNDNFVDGSKKFLEYLRKNYDRDRPMPLKNPMTNSPENLRRWAIVNIPKLDPNGTGKIDFFSSAGGAIQVYIRLWYFIYNINAPKLEKLRYWKYYTKSLQQSITTLQEAHYLNNNVQFLQYLKENYDKEEPIKFNPATVSNPFYPNIDNTRRWAFLHFPKYLQNKNLDIKPYAVSWALNFDKEKMREDYEKYFYEYSSWYESFLSEYSYILRYIYNSSNLSNIEKQRYWKYYMSSTEIAGNIYHQGTYFWRHHRSLREYDNNKVEWTQILRDNYDKI